MDPLITLYEREAASSETLPPTLASHYGGGLFIPRVKPGEQPRVIANFVETLDGIVSYNAPKQTGGGMISGNNKQDRMVMGILRAQVDAVIFGANSLHIDANHLRIPSSIYPPFATEYDALRVQLGCSERFPISVIMTASGQLDLRQPTFHTPGLRALIATTPQGYAQLSQQELPPGTVVRVIETQDDATKGGVSPHGVLSLLSSEYGVRLALYEGGPTLLTSFLAAQLIDELFLTVAPQIAGQSASLHRLSLGEGHAFMPKDAPWATLLSVKLAGSHLFLRYRLTQQ